MRVLAKQPLGECPKTRLRSLRGRVAELFIEGGRNSSVSSNESPAVNKSPYQILVGGVNRIHDIGQDPLELLGQELFVVPPLNREILVKVAGDVAVPAPVLDALVVGVAQMTDVGLRLPLLIILNDLIPQL